MHARWGGQLKIGSAQLRRLLDSGTGVIEEQYSHLSLAGVGSNLFAMTKSRPFPGPRDPLLPANSLEDLTPWEYLPKYQRAESSSQRCD